ncbi:MAG: endolytic transglycosylase MltG [bacterium]|nr:endolytic transglycosylase MltG [bacterium]
MKGVLLISLIVLTLGSLFWLNFKEPGGSAERERFVVSQNELFEEKIIDQMVAGGYLRNKNIFNWILDLKGWHGRITPGAYFISKDMNAYELAQTLSQGPSQKWVLIPPGKRKEQVALILQKTLSWARGRTLNFIQVSEEGYLYPDTYLVDIDADSQRVNNMMRTNFNNFFNADLQKSLLSQNIRNDTALKIASLIERESGSNEDKPIIAAIIWNRLATKMPLEIDASIQYAAASTNCQLNDAIPLLEDCDFWPRVTKKMLRSIPSSYNTYLNRGLPPGPIASPSLASLQAVASPAQSDALYYIHSSDKQIHTARTYKEHKENIERYLN